MAVDQDTKRGDRSVVASATTQDVGILDSTGALVDPATEGKQDTGNASLASIDGKVATAAKQLADNHNVQVSNSVSVGTVGSVSTVGTVGSITSQALPTGASTSANQTTAITELQTLTSKTKVDAFGNMRVSESFTIFDSKMIHDKQPLFFDEETNGTATSTHNFGGANVAMAVSANADYVIRQTFMRFNYQPGKGQKILCTGVLGDPVASTEGKIGYFNTSTASAYTADEDGIYFGQDGTDVYIAISKDGTQSKVTQANWNMDTMDGNGASGITLDFDATQIFHMEFEWLGVGSVWFGVVVDGVLYYVHRVDNANNGQTDAYMASPNHSVRYEVRSTGGTITMQHICSTVVSEGGVEQSGVTRGFGNDITPVTCGTTLEGILFYRVSATEPDTTLLLNNFSVLNTSNNASNYRWVLIVNPTIAGTAPTYSSLSNSGIEYAVGAGDNTLTNGTIIEMGYAAGDVPTIALPANPVVYPGVSITGTQDVFALAIQTFTGTDSFVGAFNIREVTSG